MKTNEDYKRYLRILYGDRTTPLANKIWAVSAELQTLIDEVVELYEMFPDTRLTDMERVAARLRRSADEFYRLMSGSTTTPGGGA